jgi:hypothetical protein
MTTERIKYSKDKESIRATQPSSLEENKDTKRKQGSRLENSASK